MWSYAYGEKLSQSSVGVLNTLLSPSQPFMVASWKRYAWFWDIFCSWSYKPTSGGLCLHTGLSLLGTDGKKTGSEALGCVGNGTYESAGSSKEMHKAPEAYLKYSIFCGVHRIRGLKSSEERSPQLQSATSWLGFHCRSAVLLPFPAPANKFSFETVFSLSNRSKLKSTRRENSSLSGKAKNEAWGNCAR